MLGIQIYNSNVLIKDFTALSWENILQFIYIHEKAAGRQAKLFIFEIFVNLNPIEIMIAHDCYRGPANSCLENTEVTIVIKKVFSLKTCTSSLYVNKECKFNFQIYSRFT